MLSYNIAAIGFHNYTIYKEESIYFWSKIAAQELLLSYNNQQKVIQGLAKVESLGAISESKACLQQRNRDEEAQEPTGLLLFSLNWKTQGVRCIKKDEKDKEFEQYLYRSTKLKCKAHALFQSRHTPTPKSLPARKKCSARKRKLGDKIRRRKTNLLEAASHNVQGMLVM
ncbi:hypothetical protein RDI58_001060 [Solanum bulbocastanum]|uniref:Uncharacterized protein n=1 Tax=Solanum bulbocastanum TaxID=147425 RepID=A0AAN8UC20_SOLBU